jgi:hypothetical protein
VVEPAAALAAIDATRIIEAQKIRSTAIFSNAMWSRRGVRNNLEEWCPQKNGVRDNLTTSVTVPKLSLTPVLFLF